MPDQRAHIRYRVIDSCLKNGGIATLDDLKDACEEALGIHPLGRRTIEADIHNMRYNQQLGYNAPIVFDRDKRGYRYESDNYSLDNFPLDQE